MTEMGKAMMGTGEAGGEDRALNAAHNAIQNPLLDEVSLKGAKAVLVNVTGGLDMTLLEVDEAANAISSEVDPDANIIFGAAFDPTLEGKIRVSVVATGMDSIAGRGAEPLSRVASTAAPLIAPRGGQQSYRAPVRSEPLYAEPALAEAVEIEQVAAAIEAPAPWLEPAAASAPEPELFEAPPARPSIRIVDPSVEEEDDLYLEPAPASREPAIQAPRSYAQERAPERREPEAYEPAAAAPEPRRGGGWLSLFGGRPRYEAPPAPPARAPAGPSHRAAAQHGSAAQAVAMQPSEAPEATEDLDIPSFLRRLAN
jgi:cell division protein FtsZ